MLDCLLSEKLGRICHDVINMNKNNKHLRCYKILYVYILNNRKK